MAQYTVAVDFDGVIHQYSWLKRYRMDDLVDQVTNEKVTAVAYIDDRAVRFQGDWDQVLARLGEQPWWKQDG